MAGIEVKMMVALASHEPLFAKPKEVLLLSVLAEQRPWCNWAYHPQTARLELLDANGFRHTISAIHLAPAILAALRYAAEVQTIGTPLAQATLLEALPSVIGVIDFFGAPLDPRPIAARLRATAQAS